MRKLAVSLLIGAAAAAGWAAPVAVAAPGAAECDGAACVPYVDRGVSLYETCEFSLGAYNFGLTSSGTTVVCGVKSKWAPSKPLIGVRYLGHDCAGQTGYVAQGVDGRPLACNGTSWKFGDDALYAPVPPT